jgi:hypothetical protein
MATLNYTPNSESVSSKQTWEIPCAGGGGGGGSNTAPENYYNGSGVWEPDAVGGGGRGSGRGANTAPATGSNGSGVWVPYVVVGGGGGSPVTVLTTLEIIELLKEAIEAWDAPAALKSLAERIHEQPYGTEQQAWLALIEAASEHAISL